MSHTSRSWVARFWRCVWTYRHFFAVLLVNASLLVVFNIKPTWFNPTYSIVSVTIGVLSFRIDKETAAVRGQRDAAEDSVLPAARKLLERDKLSPQELDLVRTVYTRLRNDIRTTCSHIGDSSCGKALFQVLLAYGSKDDIACALRNCGHWPQELPSLSDDDKRRVIDMAERDVHLRPGVVKWYAATSACPNTLPDSHPIRRFYNSVRDEVRAACDGGNSVFRTAEGLYLILCCEDDESLVLALQNSKDWPTDAELPRLSSGSVGKLLDLAEGGPQLQLGVLRWFFGVGNWAGISELLKIILPKELRESRALTLELLRLLPDLETNVSLEAMALLSGSDCGRHLRGSEDERAIEKLKETAMAAAHEAGDFPSVKVLEAIDAERGSGALGACLGILGLRTVELKRFERQHEMVLQAITRLNTVA